MTTATTAAQSARSLYEVDTSEQRPSGANLHFPQELRVLPLPGASGVLPGVPLGLGDLPGVPLGLGDSDGHGHSGVTQATNTHSTFFSGTKASTGGRPASMYSLSSAGTGNRTNSMHSIAGSATLTRPPHVSKSSGELKAITENDTGMLHYPSKTSGGHTYNTRSIVDIYSEVNKRRSSNIHHTPSASQEHKNARWYTNESSDIEYLKWVSETNNNNLNVSTAGGQADIQAKLTPTDSSCSSTKSNKGVTKSDSDSSRSSKGGGSSSGVSSSSSAPHTKVKTERNSSPDSGCDMSVMVAYTSEPRVRRPADYSPSSSGRLKPTPAPRQTLRKTRSESSSSKGCDGANLVTDEELSDQGSREETMSPENTKTSLSLAPHSISVPRSNLELTSPCSRAGIYSLEGSRLQTELEQQTSDQSSGTLLGRRNSEQEQYSSSSGKYYLLVFITHSC